MKKLVTLILVLAGIVGTASATTTRLFIYMVDNWKTYSGGTKIYTWDTSGNKYTGEYNSLGTLFVDFRNSYPFNDKITTSLQENVAHFQKIFSECADIKMRIMKIGQKQQIACMAAYIP